MTHLNKNKRIPLSINKETGEKYLNFSYMLLSDATKKLKKLRAQKTPKSFRRHLYITILRLKILVELITFEFSYWVGEVLQRAKNTKRYLFIFFPQKLKRGFTDQELWNLDLTIVDFITKYLGPRIQGFREMKRESYPSKFQNPEQWEEILKDIHEGFLIIKEEGDLEPTNLSPGDKLKVQKSLELFSKYWVDLWD